MSLLPRKKSNSWHHKTPAIEKKVSELISVNNKLIFSEILAAKLATHSSSFKLTKSRTNANYPLYTSKELPNLEQQTLNFSSQKHLNHSFSRFSKCNCCGSNSFYEQQQTKSSTQRENNASKSKKLLAQELEKIKNFSIIDLKHQAKTIRCSIENSEKKPISPEKLIFPQQNFYQELVPQEKTEENEFLSILFKQTNSCSYKPIENTFIQAMLSLKKELPTAFSQKSMNRKEILILKRWFANQEEILKKRSFKNIEDKTNCYFELYSLCLNEVIKEISVECSDKGEIISEIWQKFIELLSSHRLYVEQETKKIRESSSTLIENAIAKQKSIVKESERLLKERLVEIDDLNKKNQEIYKKMSKMEESNKNYWEELSKFRYLCKTLNEKYVNLKKDYQSLHEKLYLKSEFEEGKIKPDIYINNQTPDHSPLITPKKEENLSKIALKFKEKECKSKEETPSSVLNNSEMPSLNVLKGVLTNAFEDEEESKNNIKVPPQIQSIFKKNEEVVEKNKSLLKPMNIRKTSLNERIPIINEPARKNSKDRRPSSNKDINELNKLKKSSTKHISIKVPESKTQNQDQEDSNSDSKVSFLSNLEICEEEKNQITVKELNGLVKMVHPDKFQLALLDNSTQVQADLYNSWHKDQSTQSAVVLLEQKYDFVFSNHKDIQEFMNDYSQKKEIQKLFHQKNLSDLESCETVGKKMDEMIEESFHSTEKFSELKEILLDKGSISPNEHKIIEFNTDEVPLDQIKEGIELTNTVINSPMLKYKTMAKTKELLLKVIRVYMKENAKNIVFGNEIRLLNELLAREKKEKEDIEIKYSEIIVRIENNPMMLLSNRKTGLDMNESLDDDFNMEDSDDEKEDVMHSNASSGLRRKRPKTMTVSQKVEDRTEFRQKPANPGIQMIQQIKDKNLAKFQNVISSKMIYKIIYQIYQDRITLIKENPQIKEMDCPSFSYNYFIKCYGFKKMAQQKFVIFVLSLKKAITQLRINVFSKFLGLLQNSMNYNLEEFNQYIFALDFVTNSTLSNNAESPQNPTTIGTVNKETDSRFMVNFSKSVEFARLLEKECEGNEFFLFKKELEGIKEEDPKNYFKSGIVDFDMFMSKYLNFYRKIKNQGKKNLVLAFKSADLNSDGFVDFFEFGLMIKWLEKEFRENKKQEGIEKLFKDNADIIINKDEKHMSFNNFCSFAEEFGLFEYEKLFQFVGLKKEEEISKLFEIYVEKWNNSKKKKIFSSIDFIDDKSFWLEAVEKLEKKLEKTQSDEKIKLSTLIGFKMIEYEVEDCEKMKKINIELLNKEVLDK